MCTKKYIIGSLIGLLVLICCTQYFSNNLLRDRIALLEGHILHQSVQYKTLEHRYSRLQQIRARQRVTFTAYNPLPSQTDRTPFITASGDSVTDRTLAVSRDLLTHFNPHGHFSYGDTVYAIIPLQVRDTMHHRWRNRADLLFFDYQTALNFGIRDGWLLKYD